MAYRRKQGIQRSATFVEDHRQSSSSSSGGGGGGSPSPAIASPRATRFADDSRRPERSALGAQARITSSAALGGEIPAFGERLNSAPAFGERLNSAPASARATDPLQDPVTQLFTSPTNLNDEGSKYDLELSKKDATRHGFWALVAQKAKVMLDENGTPRESHQPSQSRWSYDRVQSAESPLSRRGSETKLDIGGKIKNVLEKEGLAMSESRAGGGEAVSPAIRRLQVRRKASSMDLRGANMFGLASPDMSPMMSDTESPQIMASRDVASAMAAKVKLLQRELKTVKADLTFSKERCAQLEEENRLLRDGNHNADEDLIRQQLETLLGEKARLANENTVYARENRFLREIVEFHQLNMQDVVNLDDDDDIDEEEYDEDIEEEEEDVHAEPEFDKYDDLGASSPSHCLQEEEAQFPLPDVLDTTPLSPSQQTQPGLLSTNSGGNIACESPRMRGTNSGGAIANDESPRTLSANSGGASEDEMHRSFKDDGSTPETRTDV